MMKFVVVVLVAIVLVSQCDAHQWYVSPTASPNGNGSFATPFQTIQAALDKCEPYDSVMLLPGVYEQSNNNFVAEIDVIGVSLWAESPKPTIIRCNGAGDSIGVSVLAGGIVHISGIKFENCETGIQARTASFSDPSRLVIMNCDFVGFNSAVSLEHYQFAVAVLHSTFSRPSSQVSQAVLSTNAFRNGTVTFQNSVFIDVTQALDTQNTDVTITDCEFKGGGARVLPYIRVDGCNNMVVSGSLFFNISGDISVSDITKGPMLVSSTSFLHSSASWIVKEGKAMFFLSTFSQNTRTSVVLDNSLCSIVNSTFTHNSGQEGGIVRVLGGKQPALRMVGSVFTDNTAITGGVVWCANGVVDGLGCTYLRNKAQQKGAVIDCAPGCQHAVLDGACIVQGNTAPQTSVCPV